MKMKGLMKKIVLLLVAILSFGTVMAETNYIRYDLSGFEGSFDYVRIVSSKTGDTTYDKIVFGAGDTVAVVEPTGTRYPRLSLTHDQYVKITEATSSNPQFYFEFYNGGNIVDGKIVGGNVVGYSDYVSAADLANAISHYDLTTLDFSQGAVLSVTGYAAPEPTSGLLLLVGGALLGLRRKRRVA